MDTWPLLSRPPVRRFVSVSARTGLLRVSSEKSGMTVCRSVGVIGRNFLRPMFVSSGLDLLEQLDLLIGLELDDGLLPVVPTAGVASLTLELAAHLHGADIGHLH